MCRRARLVGRARSDEETVRRRGWGRQREERGPEPLERLRPVRSAGLRDLTALELGAPTPEGVQLARARSEGDRPTAVVASARPGEDLIGWARVAAAAAGPEVRDAVIAAPAHSALAQRLAARAAELGQVLRLLSIPALAEPADEVVDLHDYPDAPRLLDSECPVYERVVRTIEGAAAVTSSGGIRATSVGCVLYVRGQLAARVRRDGDGVAVSIVLPERRRIFINDSNFPRWGVEVHEMIVQLAQDPRLLDTAALEHDRAVAEAIAASGASVTGRWLPCAPDGDPRLDWVGVDGAGRPVLGLVESSVDAAHAAALFTGALLVLEQRALWAPGSTAALPRLCLTASAIEPTAQRVIDALSGGSAAEPVRGVAPARLAPPRWEPPARWEPVAPSAGAEAEVEGEAGTAERVEESDESARRGRRGRRRSRRRRRGGGLGAEVSPGAEEPREDRFGAAEPEGDAEEPGEREAEQEGAAGPWLDAGVPDLDEEVEPLAERFEEEEPLEPRATHAAAEPAGAAEEAAEEEPEVEVAERARPEVVREAPRRRPRAAVVVRDDPDSILAALVLARDRRVLTSFRVVRQDSLLDYFKGPANDVSENEDLLLVGFTAQPRVRELLDTAELFRGRLQWFDHHAWPIEDLERLREAIGRESVFIEEAASPLYAVGEVTERRSRFTDKLVDLSARRLSDHDMERWGGRLVGLLRRMAEAPGEHRSAVTPVLTGRPAELPAVDSLYAEEARWVEEHDPRMVHFGECVLAVLEVPPQLDAGEVGRRVRGATGARLSLAAREGDDLVLLGSSDDKRPLNVVGIAEALEASLPWARSEPGGDRVGRVRIAERTRHPERVEQLIGELVRQRAVLLG
jgi:hypothetical protein